MDIKNTHYRDLSGFFFDESIRLETIIWLAACGHDSPVSALNDFLDDEDAETIKEVLGEPYEDISESKEEYLTELARKNKMGFLVNAQTPVPQAFHKDGGFTSYGFGIAECKWFYTEALDEAFAARLLDWKEDVIARAKKSGKKTKLRVVSKAL